MIGIIGAMSVEIEKIQAEIVAPITRVISGVTYISGKIYEQEVVVAVCGIGKVFAAICAQTMILEYKPDAIINVGVAGTLTTEIGITDIAIANHLVQHDMDTSPIGDPMGLISGINIIQIPCDETLVTRIKECLDTLEMKGLVGIIASGDQFVATEEKRKFISDEFHAIACEMEGASIAHVCYVNKVPCGVIRSISDSADHSADMDYPTFVQLAAQRSFTLIMKFLEDLTN